MELGRRGTMGGGGGGGGENREEGNCPRVIFGVGFFFFACQLRGQSYTLMI